jgi:tRNA modification GTPase
MQIDSIFALASAAGRAGIQVIRLSGPGVGAVLTRLTARPLPKPRLATLARLFNPQSGDLLDEGLVLWFPAPGSFTGEDVVELQVHGGRAVLQAITEALLSLGLRPAEPGEFSRRAFESGRLDLTEIEAIADLVDAETAAQRHQALRQMDGALGRLYEGWRTVLVRALAHLEAEIDFPEEDLPGGLSTVVREQIANLSKQLSDHLADGQRGERLRSGITVAILGAPNVGKSSLLNRLAQRDVAIVSPIAGTTRDIIEVHLDLGGYPVTLCDTAGLRESSDPVEVEGIRRALARSEAADLRLFVMDGSNPSGMNDVSAMNHRSGTLVVVNKADLIADSGSVSSGDTRFVSAQTGAGLDGLLAVLTEEVSRRFGLRSEPSLTRSRHRLALRDCLDHLQRALSAPLSDLAAEDVRLAVRALGSITGRVDVEDLLDVIFRDFCIGK